MLVLDFETRSRCDLKTAGTYKYVTDLSTDILCLAVYNTETNHKQLWYPLDGELPASIVYDLIHADFVAAHYAEFDQGIYECIGVPDYGFPEIARERWYCTAAQCRVNALPAGLDDAARCLGLKQRKDHRGSRLIQQLSIPQKDGEFMEDTSLLIEMGAYCMQDVETTVAVLNAGRRMTVNEHRDWLKTCEINERGIMVDTYLAHMALSYATAEQDEIGKRMAMLTDGKITKHTQNQRIKEWFVKELGEMHPLVEEMQIYKGGKLKLSLDKNIRRNIMEKTNDLTIQVDDKISEMVELLDDGNMSSVAKFKRMVGMADKEDHRVRGAFVFGGASQTMRYASKGVQVHNMKRDCWSPEETEQIKFDMSRGGHLRRDGHGVMTTLSKLMRPAIIPHPGNVLIVGDWSSIEARCLHWGTDTLEGDQRLNQFERGVDVYQETADELNLDDRQQGKVVELSAGYQGHSKAFQAMARNYGVKVSDERAGDIVNKWRAKNWWVVDFWHKMEQAAKDAISDPRVRYPAGVVEYTYIPDYLNGTLVCIMPGEHFIQYPEAKIEKVKTPWGGEQWSVTSIKAAYHPKADAKKWPRAALYGGLFVENFCQGFSAAVLRNALRELPNVIMHVHDEIVLEVPALEADVWKARLGETMNTVPDWADGLPLQAEPVVMNRYGK